MMGTGNTVPLLNSTMRHWGLETASQSPKIIKLMINVFPLHLLLLLIVIAKVPTEGISSVKTCK